MGFVPNTRRVLLVSYTAWAFHALAALTIAPTALYFLWGLDTNPVVWGWLQLAAIVFGYLGRVWLQEEAGRWKRRAFIAVVLLVALLVSTPALAFIVGIPDADAEASETLEPTWEETAEILVPFVAGWEGKRNQAYFDIVGVPTICFGHTRTVTADDVRLGTTWTDARCEALLSEELHEYWRETRAGFTEATIEARLTPERDASFASLSFNVGWGGVRGSTATARLNGGDIPGACVALTWWNKAGGRVVRGLVNRRTEERTLCEVGL